MGARYDKINLDEQGYNGWKNYPTWCVNLWLSNDEGLYNQTLELMAAYEPMHERVSALKAWVTDELAPDLGASFAADLLGYALGEIDWYEIANFWTEGIRA